MRILVTGAAGFVGSAYVRNLLGGAYPGWDDAEVTVLDALTYAGDVANLEPVLLHRRLTFVRGDIADPGLVARLMPGHDLVVNFAAESHVDRSIAAADRFVRTNAAGVETLLRAALDAGVATFVQVSTDEVYGSIDAGSWAEDSPVRPNSPYAASKAAGDLMALSYARTHGMDVRVTRCGNTYGPRQYPEKLVPLFVTNLLAGRPVPLYGDGGNTREWIHVDDHCRGVHQVVEKGVAGEVYHIGGGTELTNRELTAKLLRACGAGPELVRRVADRPGHDRRYSLDDSKLRGLGYRPLVPFEEGLAETVAWYRTRHEGDT
ncbi:dTDP-glucose 4,6-dehydratase [Nonomuraea rhodomycinica]|uniref:dTDP-glucose 4,6-dehydratase n=1 Tax=Nonomuraea rhodomycinica TaxID=1712872 RepID=A0A7Y6MD47_9ACTN|nr:dTDP-glucose 4,6-dehydratase [Nonomuraea rhodomycinica]NUW42244.1 dTDP-glucose 4,6-dehydratase [Nonomuraea rhodomycinica]